MMSEETQRVPNDLCQDCGDYLPVPWRYDGLQRCHPCARKHLMARVKELEDKLVDVQSRMREKSSDLAEMEDERDDLRTRVINLEDALAEATDGQTYRN